MQKEHHPTGGVLFVRESTVLPGSRSHRSIELGGGASEESEAQRRSYLRRKATSRALLRCSPQVRRHKRFARQNLGAGRIHSARASQIAPGAERAKRAKPKKKDTLRGVFLFGGLEGDRTLDLTDANRTLSQLSYEPIFEQGETLLKSLYTFCEKMQLFSCALIRSRAALPPQRRSGGTARGTAHWRPPGCDASSNAGTSGPWPR